MANIAIAEQQSTSTVNQPAAAEQEQQPQTFESNITYTHGFVNAFTLMGEGDALIIGTNCDGELSQNMEKATQTRYRCFNQRYKAACLESKLYPGKVLYSDKDTKGQTLIAFPTKNSAKGKSRLEVIEMSLVKLLETYAARETKITRLIFTKVGCGEEKGLTWREVGPALVRRLGALNIPVVICVGAKDKQYHLDPNGNIVVLEPQIVTNSVNDDIV